VATTNVAQDGMRWREVELAPDRVAGIDSLLMLDSTQALKAGKCVAVVAGCRTPFTRGGGFGLIGVCAAGGIGCTMFVERE
jgi:hypothetical protein